VAACTQDAPTANIPTEATIFFIVCFSVFKPIRKQGISEPAEHLLGLRQECQINLNFLSAYSINPNFCRLRCVSDLRAQCRPQRPEISRLLRAETKTLTIAGLIRSNFTAVGQLRTAQSVIAGRSAGDLPPTKHPLLSRIYGQ